MSYHIDREEFDEWVAEEAWDRIWAAYEYAVNGGEVTTVERLKKQLENLQDANRMLRADVDMAAQKIKSGYYNRR